MDVKECLETVNHVKYKLYYDVDKHNIVIIIILALPRNLNPAPGIMKFYNFCTGLFRYIFSLIEMLYTLTLYMYTQFGPVLES